MTFILAGLGLGSATLSFWITKYNWVFLVATLLFMGFALYRFKKEGKKTTRISYGVFVVTMGVSLGLVLYALL